MVPSSQLLSQQMSPPQGCASLLQAACVEHECALLELTQLCWLADAPGSHYGFYYGCLYRRGEDGERGNGWGSGDDTQWS